MCDSDGKPDFKALMEGTTGDLCAWCFDLLELNGRGLRRRTLIERKAMLRHLLNKADDHVLRFSEPFPDPVKLLAAAESAGLEGIVSKLGYQPIARARTPDGSRSSAARGARRTAIGGSCLSGAEMLGVEGSFLY